MAFTMPDLDAIQGLIARYRALSPNERRGYNEWQTRITFIDPLFRSLGWNLEDTTHVQVEHSTISGRADYAFKLGGSIRFYVEAKKLDEDLYQQEYARQAITYAYNTGVGFALLCNFARLIAFDTLEELGDHPPRRIIDLTVDEYCLAPISFTCCRKKGYERAFSTSRRSKLASVGAQSESKWACTSR
jgi:hypothetical protein